MEYSPKRTRAVQQIATRLKVPDKYRNTVQQLNASLRVIRGILQRSVAIQERRLSVGKTVEYNGDRFEVSTIASNFTLRFKGRKGQFEPLNVTVIES